MTFLSPIEDQMRADFPAETHPYRVLDRAIHAHLVPDATVLDIGCGRTAPNLAGLRSIARTLYGIDLVPFVVTDERLTLFNNDVCAMDDIPSESVDVAYSRAVMEHVEDPRRAFLEIRRVLKPGGVYIFLTPSLYDYGSLVAAVVPNGLHPRIVRATEGRAEEDVFPTFYKCNTKTTVKNLTKNSKLKIKTFEYMGQYPNYFRFNRVLFWMGSRYQKIIENVPALHPLQGWIFCIIEK